MFGDGFAQECKDCVGKLCLGLVEFVVGDMFVHDAPQALNRVQVWAIWGQLDEMNAAIGPRQPLADFFTFVVRGVVPDYMDYLFVAVLRLDFLQKRDGAVAVNFDNLDKRCIKILKAQGTVDVHPLTATGGFDCGI